MTRKTSCSTVLLQQLDGQAVNLLENNMSNKISYAEMKNIYNTFLENIFKQEAALVHGWSKDDFLECLHREIQCDMDEELSFSTPVSLEIH